MLPGVVAAAAFFWASAAAAQAGAGEEAHNVRLVGFHDLAARSAYQPTIKRQGERWIAYVGLAIILYVAGDMIYRGFFEVLPIAMAFLDS